MSQKRDSIRIKCILFFVLLPIMMLYAEFNRENGVVTDTITQLEWQDDYTENSGEIKETMWQYAIDYCESLNLDGGGWRLPNINELASLINDRNDRFSIDYTFEYITYNYWSSTTYPNDSSLALYVSFLYGDVAYNNKDSNISIRCVREQKNN